MNRDEVEAIYREYGNCILERCQRILRDPQSAEDATHEVFVRLLREVPGQAPPRVVLAYVYRIATNYCLNVLRDRRPVEGLDAAAAVPASVDPERMLADRDLAARMVSRAPAKLREVAWLRYGDGLSQEEVAEVMGLSRRTVINRLSEFEKRSRQFVLRTQA